PEFADVVFVALELALEIGVVSRARVALAVALHRREDLVLGQAGLGRKQSQHEAEQPLFDRDPGRTGLWHEKILAVMDAVTPGRVSGGKSWRTTPNGV